MGAFTRNPHLMRFKAIISEWLAYFGKLAQKHRKVVATTFSVGLHVLLILILMIQDPRGLSGGGYAGVGTAPGEGVAVTLVNGEAFGRMMLAVKVPAPDASEDQITPLEADRSTDMLLASTDTQIVPQVLGQHQIDSFPAQSDVEDGGQSGSPGNGGQGSTGDDLWGAIAPCWNRLADDKTLPVTLRVSFAPDGNLAAPPVIDADPSQQSDPNVQRSETIAMQALAQCGAYAMAEGKEDVKINFPRP